MTLDARALKERYREKWVKSNARERFVLAALNAFLPKPWRAELTGLGAGEDRLIERTYSGVEEAFDITVYHGDAAIAFVDVTGVASVADARRHECSGYCVGSWKLGKCRRHRVCGRAWVALVVDEDLRVLWLPLAWLDQAAEAPYVRGCRLYGDERIVLCTDSSRWKRFKHFKNWLVHTALYQTLAARA
ncbi:MAG: hypothetical protein GSR80_000622 [Desulfurococcales archaeon]|nr:hypothetical protein [Desulfurococcales archaeon]